MINTVTNILVKREWFYTVTLVVRPLSGINSSNCSRFLSIKSCVVVSRTEQYITVLQLQGALPSLCSEETSFPFDLL